MACANVVLFLICCQSNAPHTKTELVASTNTVQAGKSFQVALHMTMAPEWHSYYINPGESGQATTIKWHLPAGFKAGPIQWPVPKRNVLGGVAAYVYEHEAWLVTDITPPANLALGQKVHIGADISWLLCQEVCVPQKSALSLELATNDNPVPNPRFDSAKKALPTKLNPSLIRAYAKKDAVRLRFKTDLFPASGLEFYPSDAKYFGADPHPLEHTKSGMNLVIPLSKYAPGIPKHVSGILVVPSGNAKGAHWIDVQVTEP